MGARCAALTGVQVGHPSHPIAGDPVQRMIRAHAKSIGKARRNHQCDMPPCSSPPCDTGQCRIIVNALRREIDRLMRGIDRDALCYRPRFAHTLKTCPSVPGESDDKSSPEGSTQLAFATSARKAYAAAPLGPSLSPPASVPTALNDSSNSNPTALSTGEKLIDLIA